METTKGMEMEYTIKIRIDETPEAENNFHVRLTNEKEETLMEVAAQWEGIRLSGPTAEHTPEAMGMLEKFWAVVDRVVVRNKTKAIKWAMKVASGMNVSTTSKVRHLKYHVIVGDKLNFRAEATNHNGSVNYNMRDLIEWGTKAYRNAKIRIASGYIDGYVIPAPPVNGVVFSDQNDLHVNDVSVCMKNFYMEGNDIQIGTIRTKMGDAPWEEGKEERTTATELNELINNMVGPAIEALLD